MIRRNPEAWGHIRDAGTRDRLQEVLERAQLAHVRLLEASMRRDARESRSWESRLEAAEKDLGDAEREHGPAWRRPNPRADLKYDAFLSYAKKDLLEARRVFDSQAIRLLAAKSALYWAEKAYRISRRRKDPMRVATADQLRWEATKEIAALSPRRPNAGLLRRALLRA
jgi:hypothetical protein